MERLLVILLVAISLAGCGNWEQKGKPMVQGPKLVSEETARFHQLVEDGDLESLRTALQNGANVNAPGRVGWTALMVAIDAKNVEKAKLLIDSGADAELTDDFNNTALRHAVDADFEEGVRYLISLGVDRGHNPKYPLKKINYDFTFDTWKMPEQLKEVMSEAEWKESIEKSRETLRDLQPTVEPTISAVQSVAVLKLFLRAGDDLGLASTEMKRAYIGLETSHEFRATRADYETQKAPRYGSRNPEPMDILFWRDMIRTGGNAYSARTHFKDEDSFSERRAVWCYERFGSSLTELNDGRFVQIGGEHEDYYDPDFHIYNDVVVHDGKGDFQIFGYPREVFPPTDFHTATLCGDGIYIIGCLGYPDDRREEFTPVYRLTLNSWEMKAVETTGQMPGWIHKHRARFDRERNVISVEGGEVQVTSENGEQNLVSKKERFELDLSRMAWRRAISGGTR
jgi:hypothetical protein